jgi:hypothetical protein
MSGIRKFKRSRKALNKPKKVKTKLTVFDGILIAGLALACLGIITAGYNYRYYSDGVHEGVINTRYEGAFHVEHEEAGQLKYKERAVFWVVVAAIGLGIAGMSSMAKYTKKKKAK